MNGENRLLVIDEPVGFKRQVVDIQDFRSITNLYKKNIWNIPQANKENPVLNLILMMEYFGEYCQSQRTLLWI